MNHQVFKGICVCYGVILVLTIVKYGYFDSCHKNICLLYNYDPKKQIKTKCKSNWIQDEDERFKLMNFIIPC